MTEQKDLEDFICIALWLDPALISARRINYRQKELLKNRREEVNNTLSVFEKNKKKKYVISRVRIVVVHTNEELIIARHTV